MEEVLSAWLRVSSERDFVLVIAGRISGIHDEKGKHRPIACQVAGSALIIEFEGSESLAVRNPIEIIMLPGGELVVSDADEARFAWYSHQDPRIARKLCEEAFKKIGRSVEFSRKGAPFATSAFFAYAGDQFIVLRCT